MMTIVLSQVLALGMFIGYLVYHEPFFVRQVATHNAEMMARSFAAGAQTWMFYDDTTRMVALVQSFGEFSTRESAMLLDTEGKILAHNQREKVGSYLPEALKQKLSGQSREVVVLGRDDDLIDIAAPVVKGGSLLGWARLTLKTSEFDRLMLRNMLGNAAWFLLATLIISGLIGWGLAAGLTRDIVAISELSQDVSAGQHQRRLYLDRDDELGQLAEDFNQMLNTLDNQERMLKAHAKALKRSNEELERFAYVASHDLQEPLRMVSSYVQLLERRYKGKLDADADDFIHFAVDGAARMQQLINDLLQFSRVDSRGGEIRPADLNETLDKALFALQISLKEKEATIERVPLPTLPVDAAQITQVWQNLIGNALKFQAEAKPPVIRIGAIEELDRWRFSVSDNGIGIEPGQEERIFQIFQRLHTREAYPGTGIGLSICKRIVERHGGTIGIISVYGEGSEFWFTLPKVAEQKEDIHD
jgi:signal transduction histidine kinase